MRELAAAGQHVDAQDVALGDGLTGDGAVVGNVDRTTGFLGDRTYGRATLTDDITNLVRMYLERHDTRRMFGHLFTRRIDRLVHLAKDMQATVFCLCQRLFHDLLRNTLDLDIHLQRGNTVLGTGNLEVHVAEMVLVTEDIGQHGIFILFLDQAHGHTRNRRAGGHTGIHQ